MNCPHCEGEHYPVTSGCIETLLHRVKELESRLGAATSGVVSASAASPRRETPSPVGESRQAGESASVPTAAPSVSVNPPYVVLTAEEWRELSINMPPEYYKDRRAIDLAAAVTKWYESDEGSDHDDADLFDIVGAFVRGEPLPQKGD